MKELGRERSAAATDKGRDATRIGKLNDEELDFLWNKNPRRLFAGHGGKYQCMEFPDAPHVKGYPRANFQGSSFAPPFNKAKMLYLSHVALARAGNHTTDKDDEASHLCGNSKCVAGGHLVWEPHKINVSRTSCVGDVECGCGKISSFCEHDPKCIKLKVLP